ncbi:MAG: biotin/lipoyl-binding protein [Clostridiales bacterium]|nr:biotin/lipoyl-binding protein [Clostridiales bacterium]
MKSPWIRGLLVVILLAVIVGVYWVRGNEEPQALQVETFTVKPGVFVEEVQASGQLAAVEPTDVTAPFSAPIEKVLVQEGDRVEKGDLLLVLDSTSLKEQVVQAKAQVEQAQSQLAKLQKQVSDQEKLNQLQIQERRSRSKSPRTTWMPSRPFPSTTPSGKMPTASGSRPSRSWSS